MTECTDGLDYRFGPFNVDLDYANLDGNIYTIRI